MVDSSLLCRLEAFWGIIRIEFSQNFVQIIDFSTIFNAQGNILTFAPITGKAAPIPLFLKQYDVSGRSLFFYNFETGNGRSEFTRVVKRAGQLTSPAPAAGWHIEFHG
jgi:hypothetical protein